MVKSMTAYHAIHSETSFGSVFLEIHSVNRKHLEVVTHLPKEWIFLDPDLKKWVGEKVERGHVSFRLTVSYHEHFDSIQLNINKPLFKALLGSFKELSKESGVPFESSFNLNAMVDSFELIQVEQKRDESLYRETLKEIFLEAIVPFISVKELEGKALSVELLTYIKKIEGYLTKIKEKEPSIKKLLEEKWRSKLKEISHSLAELELEEKVLKEVAFWLEKGDITEERVRLSHHLESLKSVLKGDKEGGGKKIEFLLQEIHREMNTMGSKVQDIELSSLVIEIKGFLEKMKEQAFNIE